MRALGSAERRFLSKRCSHPPSLLMVQDLIQGSHLGKEPAAELPECRSQPRPELQDLRVLRKWGRAEAETWPRPECFVASLCQPVRLPSSSFLQALIPAYVYQPCLWHALNLSEASVSGSVKWAITVLLHRIVAVIKGGGYMCQSLSIASRAGIASLGRENHRRTHRTCA